MSDIVKRGKPIPHHLNFCNSDGEVLARYRDGWECPFCGDPGVKNYCPSCGAVIDVDGLDSCSEAVSKEEREREICRSNYAAQLEGLGYNADGTPKGSECGNGE